MDLEGRSDHFLMCHGKSCTRKGAEAVTNVIRETLAERDPAKTVHTTKTWCNGQCKHGPIVILYPKGTWYRSLTPILAKQLVLATLQQQPFFNHRFYRYTKGRFQKENDPKEG
ncbi:(2Fe-2S) ferredoxin domain-containing protein [Geomicrobium sediminis]|uniref:(2Fe-2S) ferredoxin n=1 Tax=Geomicrobium sediminis TaxID=1347788 RepID=A0ABS2PFA9_9BACL|nr:(2Fe-2S) ferredoxin domain-containing protein [Geomicrobium sediminis]MBM7634019.1 (2Fe-2S) ferredoxin [Geomicrobium sediminis]